VLEDGNALRLAIGAAAGVLVVAVSVGASALFGTWYFIVPSLLGGVLAGLSGMRLVLQRRQYMERVVDDKLTYEYIERMLRDE
jgi:hypothetical protein